MNRFERIVAKAKEMVVPHEGSVPETDSSIDPIEGLQERSQLEATLNERVAEQKRLEQGVADSNEPSALADRRRLGELGGEIRMLQQQLAEHGDNRFAA